MSGRFSFLLCVSVHCACFCVEGHTCLQMCPCMGATASVFFPGTIPLEGWDKVSDYPRTHLVSSAHQPASSRYSPASTVQTQRGNVCTTMLSFLVFLKLGSGRSTLGPISCMGKTLLRVLSVQLLDFSKLPPQIILIRRRIIHPMTADSVLLESHFRVTGPWSLQGNCKQSI